MSFLGLNRTDKELQEMVEAEDKRGRISLAIGCSIFLVIAVASLIYGGSKFYQARRESARLDAHGVSTKGHLDAVTQYFNLAMGDGYTVRYSFAVNGVTYHGSGALGSDPGSRYGSPEPVVVIYDPENPTNNRIENDLGTLGPLASKKMWIWFTIACLVICALSAIKSALGRLLRGKAS